MAICTGLGEDNNWLVTPFMVAQFNPDRELSESDCYTKGVTGQQYFSDDHEELTHPVEFVELIPEPENPVDPAAVRVMAQGKKIGFVPAKNALLLHSFIALMRNEGILCFVPLTEPGYDPDEEDYESFDDFDDNWDDDEDDYFYPDEEEEHSIGVMMLPTRRTIQRLCPVEKIFAMFDTVWESLSEESLAEIRNNSWRFGEQSFVEFREQGLKTTTYPFTIDASQHQDYLLKQYLVNYRRLIFRAQDERNRVVRNLHMMERAEAGDPYRSIGEMYGLKANSVGQIVRRGQRGEAEKWQSIADEIPADEALLKKKILEEKWGVNRGSKAQRTRWLKKHRAGDAGENRSRDSRSGNGSIPTAGTAGAENSQSEKSTPADSRFPAGRPQHQGFAPVVPVSESAPEKSGAAQEKRGGLRGLFSRMLG